jgi:hypothetical protein
MDFGNNANVNRLGNVGNSGLGWFRKNQVLGILLILVIVAFGLFLLISFWRDYSSFQANNLYLLKGTRQLSSPIVIPASQIPRASDQTFGLEFSYSMWIYINQDSYTSAPDQEKHILHKGSPNMKPYVCPAILLSRDSNRLLVKMNTYGSDVPDVCEVDNIPVAKWFHLAVVVINQNVDIYINGNLKKRFELSGLPMQNFGDVYIGRDIQGEPSYIHMSGMLSNVRYFSYALPVYRLEQLVNELPGKPAEQDSEVVPPYLSPDYYLQTGSPAVL